MRSKIQYIVILGLFLFCTAMLADDARMHSKLNYQAKLRKSKEINNEF